MQNPPKKLSKNLYQKSLLISHSCCPSLRIQSFWFQFSKKIINFQCCPSFLIHFCDGKGWTDLAPQSQNLELVGGEAIRAIWPTITIIHQFQHPVIIYLRCYEFCSSVVSSQLFLQRPFLAKNVARRHSGRALTNCWGFRWDQSSRAGWLKLLSVDAPPSKCKWVTFRRARGGSSARWAVTVMGWRLA